MNLSKSWMGTKHVARFINKQGTREPNKDWRLFVARFSKSAVKEETVHWLRHTGIMDDINKRGRPISQVRDDAGHSSSAITDRYNDTELQIGKR